MDASLARVASDAELLEEEADDRDVAARPLPRIAHPFVVDETGGFRRPSDRGGGGLGERRRLDLVAVGGERLEALPQRLDGAGLLTERERAGIAAGTQLGDDALPEVVVREPRRRPVRGDRVQPPFQRYGAGPVVEEPRLRSVHVAVRRRPEPL